MSENNISVSFEFFPPSSPEAVNNLWSVIERLAPLHPDFVSVTYGAGGSTRERTHSTLERILKEKKDLKPAAHLTCVSATKEQVRSVVDSYHEIGVRHIVALRGDAPEGIGCKFTPHPEGYQSSIDLIKDIKKNYPDMDITVSAYPEKHPESPDWDTELDFLEKKIEAGATKAVSQFFFYNDHFEAYVDKARRRGITIPIIPGILPITNFEQTRRFAERTGALIPNHLAHRFAGLENDVETRKLVGMMVAAEQVEDLKRRGQKQFHFYTMNRAELVFALCHVIGIRV